jgi:hypothetical protein
MKGRLTRMPPCHVHYRHKKPWRRKTITTISWDSRGDGFWLHLASSLLYPFHPPLSPHPPFLPSIHYSSGQSSSFISLNSPPLPYTPKSPCLQCNYFYTIIGISITPKLLPPSFSLLPIPLPPLLIILCPPFDLFQIAQKIQFFDHKI